MLFHKELGRSRVTAVPRGQWSCLYPSTNVYCIQLVGLLTIKHAPNKPSQARTEYV